MTKRLILALSLLLGFSSALQAEPAVPVFSYPLKKVTHKTGSFGEFRQDHFHSGTDISTLGQTGWDVLSPIDGYVSRIKVSSFGYGKAVYLTTYDGRYTVVFAHLMRFRGDVDRYIRSCQFKNAEYFQDVYPDKKSFPVKKGEVISYSGDTGGVFPHLHYEVRDKDEMPIRFSISELEKKDNKPPVLRSVAIHPLSADAVINGKHKSLIRDLVKTGKGQYKLKQGEVFVRGKVGISLYAYDESRGNKLGLNRVILDKSKESRIAVDIHRFSYDEYNKIFFAYSREAYLETQNGFLNLYKNKRMGFLYEGDDAGIIDVGTEAVQVNISGFDSGGNMSKAGLTFLPMKEKRLDYKDKILIHGDRIFCYADSPGVLRISMDGVEEDLELFKKDEMQYSREFAPKPGKKFQHLTAVLLKNGKEITKKDILAVVAQPGKARRFAGGMYFLRSFKDSLEQRKIIQIREAEDLDTGNDELLPAGMPAFILEPLSLAFWDSVRIGVQCGPGQNLASAALFINHFGKWQFLSREKKDGYFVASLKGGEHLAVLKDETPPVIEKQVPDEASSREKDEVAFTVVDEGAGLDYSSMEVSVDGVRAPYQVNTRTDVVKVYLGDKSGQGENSVRIYIKARDNTGNSSEKDFKISLR